LGGFHTAPHFAAAWAHANNAPFPWRKQTASHLGGTRDPMVIAWPKRIRGGGEVRAQFTHCIDVVPTILELLDIPAPTMVDVLHHRLPEVRGEGVGAGGADRGDVAQRCCRS